MALAALGWSCGLAQAEEAGTAPEGSLTSAPFVIAESPTEAQAREAEAEAWLASPEGRQEREESQSKYEGLTGSEARAMAGRSIPGLLDTPDGGPPKLPEGQQILGFVSPYTAQIGLGASSSYEALVQSSLPMAVETVGGGLEALDMTPRPEGSGFQASRGLVEARLPKQLDEGAQLAGDGLSITPVDASGAPLAGEGVVDGSSVFYANSQTDTDTVMKLSTLGVVSDVWLRSEASPEKLSYEVALPAGAKLQMAVDGTDGVDVVREGAVIARMPAPSASDAAGYAVPVSVSVSGETITLTVSRKPGAVLYPVEVDPEFNTITEGERLWQENWHFTQIAEGKFTGEDLANGLSMAHSGSYASGTWGAFSMRTKGDSKIYENTATITGAYMKGWNEISKEGVESTASPSVVLSSTSQPLTVCPGGSCTPSAGAESNGATYEAMTTSAGEYSLSAFITNLTNYISQPASTYSTTKYDSYYTTIDKTNNVIVKATWAESWLGPNQGAFEFEAKDGGLGVAGTSVEVKPANGGEWKTLRSKNYLTEGGCVDLQCSETQTEALSFKTYVLSGWPEGEDVVRVGAHDPMSKTSSLEHESGEASIKVDAEEPHGIVLSGIPSKSGVYELGEVTHTLKVEAADGKGAVLSSGIGAIELEVDEHGRAAIKGGSCEPGPCSTSAEWSLNGGELGAGYHTIKVVARDYAQNLTVAEFPLVVYSASPVAMGPGSVNPESGDFAMEATDVSMSGGTGTLSVSRHYDSLNTAEGAEGPLGPQWTIGLDSLASIEELPDGSVMLAGPAGLAHFAKKEGGGFEAPPGDGNLKLEAKYEEVEVGGKKETVAREYLVKDSKEGSTTRFTKPEGAKEWLPTVSEGPIATDTTTDTYQTKEVEGKKIVEPKLEVAPHPNATCEYKKLERGCRALEFNYAEATTAKGQAPGEWGDYKGDLTRVYFIAWDPAKGRMKEVAVAHYLYDSKGRLRAVWDPRIEPEAEKCVKEPTAKGCLATIYGYDEEGHVTAIDPPAQQPWLVRYGTIESDARTGRVLSLSRPKASVALGSGLAPVSTQAPKPSAEGVFVGQTLSVSAGAWSNAPLGYSYQWQRCSSASSCVSIAGAVNSSYTARPSDEGKELVVAVTATNAGGSAMVQSVAAHVYLRPPSYVGSFGSAGTGNGQFKGPRYIAIKNGKSAQPEVYVTDTGDNRVEVFNGNGEYLRQFATGEAPTGIAAEPKNEHEESVWVSAGRKVEWYVNGGSSRKATLEKSTGASLGGMTVGETPAHQYTIGENSVFGSELNGPYFEWRGGWGSSGSGNGQLNAPSDVAFDPPWSFLVSDSGNNRVQLFSSGGGYQAQFGKAGSGPGQFKDPTGVVPGGTNEVWVVDSGDSRVEEFCASGVTAYCPSSQEVYASQFGEAGKSPKTKEGEGYEKCIAGGLSAETCAKLFPGGGPQMGPGTLKEATGIATYGSEVFVVDTGDNRVERWKASEPAPESTLPAMEPPNEPNLLTSTVDYGVPLSGEGAPQQMGSKELEAWAQKDDPAYATAIFPPQEPMGWPAKDYKKATVRYMDSQARTVNVAGPNGGIATTEYNEDNEVERALSPSNRAKALEAGASSAEVSLKLDTRSGYDPKTGELKETKGPEHQVQLKNGEIVQARNTVHYHYDEGAPEGEEHGLVTKTTDAAVTAGGWEYDVREALTGYSGQNNLGWKLREPTSTTTDPSGLDLVHTTVYDPKTGNVLETRSPGAGPAGQETSKLLNSFGAPVGGVLPKPQAVAVDAKGNLWVADTEDSIVVETSPAGEFIRTLGSKGTGNGQLEKPQGVAIDAEGHVWVADTANNRIEEFTGTGEYVRQIAQFGTQSAFKKPAGVTVDSKGNIYVTDTGNGRVQEGKATGEFIRTFGSEGTGTGQLKEPHAAALDSKGDVWVADSGNKRAEEFSPEGAYLRELQQRIYILAVTGIAIDGEGHVWTSGNRIVGSGFGAVDEYSSEGAFISGFCGEGSSAGQCNQAGGIASAPEGKLWVADTGNGRAQEFTSAGAYLRQLSAGGPTGAAVDSKGNLWTADADQGHIQETTSEGALVRTVGAPGSGNGQLQWPQGVTVDAAGHVWVADTGNNRIQEFSAEGAYLAQSGSAGSGNGQFKEPVAVATLGEDLFVVDRGNARIQELTSSGSFVRAFGTEGEGKLQRPQGIAIDKEGHLWVTDSGDGHVVEFSSEGAYLGHFGASGEEHGEFTEPVGIQVTEAGNLWIADAGDGRVQELGREGVFLQQLAARSQFSQPAGLALDPVRAGLVVVNRGSGLVQVWQPGSSSQEAQGQGGAHSSVTVYYTATANTAHPECGSHIEWVDLPCETMIGKQPETPGLAPLPVTRIEYNVYDQPEKTTETFGQNSRTHTTTYDEAGRALSATLTGSLGETMPTIKDRYDEATGALIEQISEQEGKVLSVKREFNSLGEATSYIDASGNQTSYAYDPYGRVSEVNYDVGKLDGMEAWQRYTYDESTGALSEIQDSAAGIFKATRDIEGRIASETYPNGLKESFSYNSIGEAVSQSYVKSECSSNCTWFEDKRVPSIHGEALLEESTLAKTSDVYDSAGRLTEVKETPAGEGCMDRLYAYDVESNRMSLTNRKPAGEGKCATEGGEAQAHTYDQADRLTDSGIVYDGFGDITSLPASDAGGSAIASRFYVDGQLASQAQGETSDSYTLDPEGRTLLTDMYSKEVLASATVSHYAGASGTPSWTYNETAAKWTRQITGFDGLVAVQESAKEAVLQLSDLDGNVVETASLSSTATEPLTKERSTEFGVPVSGKPAQTYSWLGSAGLSSAFPSTGAVAKDGSTYVPQIGLPLQTTVTPPPIPVNAAKPYVTTTEPWMAAGAAAAAAREMALYEEEQRKIHEAETPVGNTPSPGEGGAGKRETEEKAGGGMIDPAGLMSGKEALTLAHELNQEGENLAAYTREETCGHAYNPNPAACELGAETGEKEDPALGKALEGCWFQVHNPGWLHKHFYTKACLVSFDYEIGIGGNRIIAKGWHVSICFSYHVGAHTITYETSRWWCGSDKKWWNFYNRGWWEDT